MKLHAFVLSVATACAVGWVGRSVFCEDAPGGSMEDWMKLAKPGEQHARLKSLVGEWAVHGKFTGPDGKVTESESTSSITMILGDRFLRQEVKGDFQGEPFEGRGVIGYDNGKKTYVSAWLDSMGTGIMVGEGEETQPGKVWTFKSSYTGPQGPVAMRDVMTVVNDKEMTWESYMGGGDKPMMSLHYRRK